MSENDKHRTRPSWRKAALTLLGLAIFGALICIGGADSLHKITRPDPFWLLGGSSVVALMLLTFTTRWRILTDRLANQQVTDLFTYYFYALSSLMLGVFIPQTAGMVASRTAALNRLENIPLGKSLTSVLFDKLFDGFMVVMFVWPGLLLILDITTLPQATAIALVEFGLVSALITMRYELWLRLVQGMVSAGRAVIKHIPLLRRVNRWKSLERLDDLEGWHMLERDTVLSAYWLTAAGQGLMVLRSWMFAQAVGLDISLMGAFIGIALAQVSLLLAITPGALGTVEAAWYLALAGAEVAPESIVTFLVAHRLFQTAALALTWLVVYLVKVRRHA